MVSQGGTVRTNELISISMKFVVKFSSVAFENICNHLQREVGNENRHEPLDCSFLI